MCHKIGLVEFVTDVLRLELLPHQKEVLYCIENNPQITPRMWFRRADGQSRYIFGWIYKNMWKEYCKTGEIKFPFYDNKESFKREYDTRWNDENNANDC